MHWQAVDYEAHTDVFVRSKEL